jgi:hypothetical protein
LIPKFAFCFLLIFLFLIGAGSVAQVRSTYRQVSMAIEDDTLQLDTLSIIPGSEIIRNKDNVVLSDSLYRIDYANSRIYFRKKASLPDSLHIAYRVFPFLFTRPYYHKSPQQAEPSDPGRYDYFTLKPENKGPELFDINGLNKNGSISRGVSFGNNQDLAVNSNLDLQLSGRISDEVGIQAAISDNNIPIQAEGNTQQLQEFDRVFIKLFTDQSELIAGDYLISRPESYFMNLNKKVQGGGFKTEVITKSELEEEDNGIIRTSINAAVSRGKFSRQIIPGQEGIQGPYQLRGEEGETFIIVLSGTERIYLNGKLMKRGQEYDYVIDYNTAELTFTPNQLITKDMRIVAEFQYAERNYGRSLIFSENEYRKEKLKVNLNLYSEQDHKNQPLLQELTDEDIRVLKDAGDNLNQAVVSGIDTVGFINDQPNYKLIDTLGFSDVLVFSKDPDLAIYTARFTEVGHGRGDYVQERSDANGRVFKWVAPLNGEPQGSFEPVIRLITPKKRQLFTLGTAYTFSKNTALAVEGAFSNNDVNTFSELNERDDQSYGMKLDFGHSQLLNTRDTAVNTRWNNHLFYEQRGKNFQYIERYRDVEFDRDWNIRGLNYYGNEYLLRAKTGLAKGPTFFNYELSSFIKGDDYEGIRNGYSGSYRSGGFHLQSKGSYLTAEADNNSSFFRHYSTVSQQLKSFEVGGYLEQERILFYQGQSDSLQANSFDRIIWKSYIQHGDSNTASFYRIFYSEIYDYLPAANGLKYAQQGQNTGIDFKLAQNPRSRLSGNVTYRRLFIKDEEIAIEDKENTLVGRADYDLKALRGFISSNTFYQIASGLEFQKQFSYIEVNDGQGTHLWNDYNGNDVKELNEFEVANANNQFQANYIKVFSPTTNFIRVFSNQFNQVLFLRPDAILKNDRKWKQWLSKFSNKTAYRAERKTTKEDEIYNPFMTDLADSSLINILSSVSNTFYFNRLDPRFGAELFYLNNTSKNLLTNGFESRRLDQREVRARYNFNRIFSLESVYAVTNRINRSEFFENRDFTIETERIEPTFIYQPSVKFRWSVSAAYAEKVNELPEFEYSYQRELATEARFNEAGKGTFSLQLKLIQIDFSGEQNSPLAFEMLEGLTDGNNITWNVLWQRNLSNNLQLNLNYSGRKSDDLRVIHTGGMQVRAFF